MKIKLLLSYEKERRNALSKIREDFQLNIHEILILHLLLENNEERMRVNDIKRFCFMKNTEIYRGVGSLIQKGYFKKERSYYDQREINIIEIDFENINDVFKNINEILDSTYLV